MRQHLISLYDETAAPRTAEEREALARQIATFLNERAIQGNLAGFGAGVRVIAIGNDVVVKRRSA